MLIILPAATRYTGSLASLVGADGITMTGNPLKFGPQDFFGVRRDMPEVLTLPLDLTLDTTLTLTLDITITLTLDLTLNILLTFTLSLTLARLRRRCRTGSTRCASASQASKGARVSSCLTRTGCPWMTRTPTGPS